MGVAAESSPVAGTAFSRLIKVKDREDEDINFSK